MTLSPEIAAQVRSAHAALQSSLTMPEKPGTWLWTQVSPSLWTHPSGDGESYHLVMLSDGVYLPVGLFGEYGWLRDAFDAMTEAHGLTDIVNEWVNPGEQEVSTQEEIIARYVLSGQRCGFHNPDRYAVDYKLIPIEDGILAMSIVDGGAHGIFSGSDPRQKARLWVGAHGGRVVMEVSE